MPTQTERRRPTTLAHPNWMLILRQAKERGCYYDALVLVAIMQEGSILDLQSNNYWSFVDPDSSELEACLELWRVASREMGDDAMAGKRKFSPEEEEALQGYGLNVFRFSKVVKRFNALYHGHGKPEPEASDWSTLRMCLLAGSLDLVFVKRSDARRNPSYRNADGLVAFLPRNCMTVARQLLIGVPVQLVPRPEDKEGKIILGFAEAVSLEMIRSLVHGALSEEMFEPEFDYCSYEVVERFGSVLRIGTSALKIPSLEHSPKQVLDPKVCAPFLAAAIVEEGFLEVHQENLAQIALAKRMREAYGAEIGAASVEILRGFYESMLLKIGATCWSSIRDWNRLRLPPFSAALVLDLVDRVEGSDIQLLAKYTDRIGLRRLREDAAEAERVRKQEEAMAQAEAERLKLESAAPELRREMIHFVAMNPLFEGTAIEIPEQVSAEALASKAGLIICADSNEMSKLCRKPSVGYPSVWTSSNVHGRTRVLGSFGSMKGGTVYLYAEQHGGAIVMVAYWINK